MEENKYILTDEQWIAFKEASPHFKSSKQEYIRNAPRWLTEQVINIYESVTGKTILDKDLSCAHCVLRVYQIAGKLYFSELDRREKLEEEKKNVVTKTNAESNQRDEKKKVGSNRNGKKRGIEDKN